MKNWTLTTAIAGILATTTAFAQISINAGTGLNPDNSAMLDVQSANKGVLISRVALTGPTDAATVPSPATSLLIYNTTSAGGLTPGYHYNSGTSGSPTWTRLMSGNTTPLSGAGTAYQVAYWSGANALTGSGTFIFGSTNNLSVFNSETTTGEVRLGAAWGRPGVYSSQQLELQSGNTGILFGNGNVEYMRLTASGNLGIGTNPVEALEIFRNGSNPVQLFHSSGVASYKLGLDGNVFKIASMDNGFGGHTGNFAANDAQVIAITTVGNVGIGNVAGSHKLHVGEATADGQGITLRSYSNTPGSWKGGAAFGFSGASVIVGQLNGVAQIGGHNGTLTGWADLAINSAAGNVGIGIINPGAKLTVRSGGTDPGANDDGKVLFVSGPFGAGQTFDGGIEFRHDNLTQGIGFGYNTIYQTGTNVNEVLHLTARGTGIMSLNSVGGATGNVGIGTTAPVGRLHVAGNHANGVLADGNDRPSVAITGVYPQMVMMSGNSGNGNHGASIMIGGYDSGASGAHKHWAIGTSGQNSTFLDFGYHGGTDLNPHSGIRNYNGSTFMTILNSGNVGIGTLSPSWKFHVVGAATPSILANQNGNHSYGVVAGLETNNNGAGTQDGPRLGFHKHGAKLWSTGIQAGGDQGYAIWEDGYNNGWGIPRFVISNANGRATLYRYRPAGTWVNADLVLERTGALDVFPSLALHNPGFSAPQVYGAHSPERINIANSGDAWTTIAASGFTTISDVRMKKEIQPLQALEFQNSLASIRNIQSIRYRYNNEVSNEPTPYSGEVKRSRPHLGFTAQSLPTEVVVDDLTRSASSNADGYILGYSLNDMDGLLLAGVKALDINQQQQTTELETMRTMLEAQKALIATMRAEIDALKSAQK